RPPIDCLVSDQATEIHAWVAPPCHQLGKRSATLMVNRLRAGFQLRICAHRPIPPQGARARTYVRQEGRFVALRTFPLTSTTRHSSRQRKSIGRCCLFLCHNLSVLHSPW